MKKYPLQHIILLALCVFSLLTSCTEDPVPLREPSGGEVGGFDYTWQATADSMQLATYNTYLGSDGTFIQDNAGNTTFHYWPNAHVLHTLVDGYIRTGSDTYLPRMKELVRGIKIKNGDSYNNVFNDDMLWLANSCVRAFVATNDQEYKDVADYLWEVIKTSWTDDVFGGGITWKQDTPKQKNAVSNGPAVVLAMRLYELEADPEDLEWAKKIYVWQKNTLVDPVSGLVWDNISEQNGEPTIQKDWIFTYNMGTYIGAGLRLYNTTKEQGYLNDAIKSAKALMTSPKLTTEGLLRDEGEGDGGLFKGILVRYFTELILQPEINASDREGFVNFLRFNAETFYDQGLARPSMLAGPNWRNKPSGKTDLTTQLSGLMLIEAAAYLEKDGVFE